MIYNMEKLDRVINKIVTDLGLGQYPIPYNDFVEWIADGLQHIGAYYQFLEKECHVLIQDYQGLLPCDLYKVKRMLGGCSISSGPGGFYGNTLIKTLEAAGVEYESLPAYERFAIVATAGLSRPGDDIINGIANRLQHNKNLLGNVSANKFTNADYNINLNKITTGFQYGVIQLQYLAFPVDERGWPLVPDDVSYRDALFWKVAYHLSMRDPSILKNERMKDMEYCRQMWNKYCVQARASANMPDLAMYERLKNNWLKLYNTTDDDVTLYRNIGKQQHLDLDGRS